MGRVFAKLSAVRMTLFALAFATLLSGCAKPAVIVTKGASEERSGLQGWCILGQSHPSSVISSLCAGDLGKILAVSTLTADQRTRFHTLICSPNTSPESVKQFLGSLPVETRIDLSKAFELYGYHLNAYG